MKTQPEIERAIKMLMISVTLCRARGDDYHGAIATSNVDLLKWVLDKPSLFETYVDLMSPQLASVEQLISQPPTSETQPPSVIGKQNAN